MPLYRKIQGLQTGENGEVIITTELLLDGGLTFGSAIQVPITGNTNDLSIPGLVNGVLVKFQPTGNFNITGIVPVDITKGGVIYFKNDGTGQIQLLENNAASLAQNRIISGGNKTIQPGEAGIIVYDTIAQKQQVFSINI